MTAATTAAHDDGPTVTVEVPTDGVALVTVGHPAIGNFGSWALVERLADALAAAREGGARATVVASAVPGHWLQHAWLPDLIATFAGGATTGDGAAWFRCLHELTATPVVTIAAVNGDTNGGGCELGWACDLRVAEEQVWFGQPEVQIGVGTGIGGTSRLRHLIGRSATAEMVLLGAPVTARRLEALGAVNRVVPEGRAVEVALSWARLVASRPPAAVAGIKQMLQGGDEALRIAETVMNDQRIFGSFSGAPAAMAGMRAVQARFDAGETPREVYGPPLA